MVSRVLRFKSGKHVLNWWVVSRRWRAQSNELIAASVIIR
jgi:hypothetical protein